MIQKVLKLFSVLFLITSFFSCGVIINEGESSFISDSGGEDGTQTNENETTDSSSAKLQSLEIKKRML